MKVKQQREDTCIGWVTTTEPWLKQQLVHAALVVCYVVTAGLRTYDEGRDGVVHRWQLDERHLSVLPAKWKAAASATASLENS